MCDITAYESRHADGIVRVVRSVFDEYGFTWEADGYCRDLYDIEGHYLKNGSFWTVLDADAVVGCAGVLIDGDCGELHRMYLLGAYRGRGLGRGLLETCMTCVRGRGCRSMRAWSDVKLTDAHRLYRKLGFTCDGQRICADPDRSVENGFLKEPL